MTHELCIMTNDGWMVTLKSDREISLGDAVLSSIIVQPKAEFEARVADEPGTPRKSYRLNHAGEVIYARMEPGQ